MERPLGRLSRWLDGVYTLCLWLAALCVAAICVLMIVQALTREFGVPEIDLLGLVVRFRGLDDIVAWLCADSAVLALAPMFKHGDLVRVTLLADRLKGGTRRAVELFVLAFAVVFIGYTAYAFGRFVHESWALNDVAQGLVKMELWIPQVPMVIGIAALWLAFVEDFVRVLRRGQTAYDAAIEERAARRDYSESL